MIVVTGEQAICMFFCEEYNGDNVEKLTKEVDDFVNSKICYTEDPTKPIILSKRTISQNPFLYHKYPSRESVANDITIEEQKLQLINSHARLLLYLIGTTYKRYNNSSAERVLNKGQNRAISQHCVIKIIVSSQNDVVTLIYQNKDIA
ncbi:uncharacterized protein B0P05DRAFT_536388 [Gilbertella persicaria]|uniref:uncharacterized protein n=1 Tax=Gilbertella persicaria TaxID=101096 RepID=UPI00222047AE|nr:uncharacterized protein B0P05DRAFT_536388 [Gilbertella persicaria]KAI8084166.1 hypothetical protein B0P05DRAFT_536388 [Gilbertella persicaria]